MPAKKLKIESNFSIFLFGFLFAILFLFIRSYLVQFCYNKVAPKILGNKTYLLTFYDSVLLVVLISVLFSKM